MHLLDEVEKVCSHVAVLMKGTLITHGHVDEILINEDIVELGTASNDQLLAALQSFPGTTSIRKHEQFVEVVFGSGEAELDRINQYCFEKGIILNHLRLRRKSLEAKFFELTKAN